MSLSNPRPLYGIHSVSPYSRTDGTFYGILKVLDGSSLNMTTALNKLMGGSQKFPWAVETGESNAEISLKVGEFPSFLRTLFLGATPTDAGVSATGSVSTLTNKYGTSVKAATTGIASIGITASTGAAMLKFGKYVVKAASATTVRVYFSSDADLARGTAGAYAGDDLEVTASALTITSGGTIVIPNFGLEFTGGSGTIGMTTGDTATFEVLPPSNKSSSVTIGGASDVLPEFGLIAMAQKTGSKQMTEIDVFRCKGGGMQMPMTMNAFAKTDIKIMALYDSAQSGVFKERWIEET